MNSPNMLWPDCQPPTELHAGALHIWALAIDPTAQQCEQLRMCLSRDELDRADRYRIERPRLRFTAARAGLRKILAAYLQQPPDAIEFEYDTFGKPALSRVVRTSGLDFNLAHSGDLAVVAVSAIGEVGVDVEQLRPVRHAVGISERFFHQQETAEVLRAPVDTLESRFFACWTRKEAVIKNVGLGLQYPLDKFCVQVTGSDASWTELPSTKNARGRRCCVQPFAPADGYVGAVATLADWASCEYRTFRWPD